MQIRFVRKGRSDRLEQKAHLREPSQACGVLHDLDCLAVANVAPGTVIAHRPADHCAFRATPQCKGRLVEQFSEHARDKCS